MSGVPSVRAIAVVVSVLLVAPSTVKSAQDEVAELRIVVIEGEESVNIIAQGTAVPTLVEVRDRNDLPVSGASVVFLLGEGGAASLNAGLQQVAMTTNALGQAAVSVNPIATGVVELSVTATYGGQTATTAIVQTNFATAAQAAAVGGQAAGAGTSAGGQTAGGGTSSGGGAAAAGIAGAVAAGVALAVAASDGEDPPPPASATDVPNPVPDPVPNPDRSALGELYNATGGPGWANNANWGSDEPLGDWHGVDTDHEGRVIRLSLAQNGLAGGIPASLSDLPNLRWLNLRKNELAGTIPPSLANLSNLEGLDLDDNRLTGTIPPSLGDLTQLEGLGVRNNGLTGTIPPSLGNLTKLRYLNLHDNGLTGTIPPSLGNLMNLERLWSHSNQLTGTIPPSLGNLANLEILSLGDNALTGTIPPSLGDLTNLEDLNLWGNALTGTIPPSLGDLPNLRRLELQHNRLTGSIPGALCRFEGTVSPQRDARSLPCGKGASEGTDRAGLLELYHATDGANWERRRNWGSDRPIQEWDGVSTDQNGRVTVLDLRKNALRGPIPDTLGNLANLNSLFLQSNQLTGTIPDSLGDLTNLTDLWLNDNRLTGLIPVALCRFEDTINPQQEAGNLPCRRGASESTDRAVLLELYNAADGANWEHRQNWGSDRPIGGWDGVRTDHNGRVTHLYHARNRLTGTIPDSLGDLTNLEVLGLSDNRLTGTIPSSLGNLTNLEVLELHGNRLTGTIPPSLGNLTNLEELDLSDNRLTGTIPPSLGNLTNLEELHLGDNSLTGPIPGALCRFEDTINPQQEGENLAGCSEPAGVGLVEARVVPGDGQLVVHWTAVSGGGEAPDDYALRYRPDTEFSAWAALADEANTTGTSATITGLTNGTAYRIEVRAGDGAWSESVIGTPGARPERLTFGDAHIEHRRFSQFAAITPVALPTATGGGGVLAYTLAPALPAGLVFDAAARMISGTPSLASPATTYTYTATDAQGDAARLTFAIEVEVSAAEAALRRDGLAAQGRALLSSVTGVIGERLRSRSAPADAGPEPLGRTGALSEAVVSMLGSRFGLGSPRTPAAASGRDVAPGGDPTRSLGGSSVRPAFGSGAVAEEASTAGFQRGSSALPLGGIGSVGLWGRSFAAPLAVVGGDGDGGSRYTLWGAGDQQSFSGASDTGSYHGKVRSLYLGTDRRVGRAWLAGAALGRSWGAADYTPPSSSEGAKGKLTTRLVSLYPYVEGKVSKGLSLWAIGGYGRGEAEDARGASASGEAGELTMTMGAAGLRQEVLEQGGVALAVVGGAGSLSLSSVGGGATVADLEAVIHRARLALEASRASGTVTPFVQLGGRYDGGDGETGTGLEVVAGLRASTTRLEVEARGRWLSVHSTAGYGESGAMARLAVKSRPDGTGLRALVTPRWGVADPLSIQDGVLGSAGAPRLHPGTSRMPEAQVLSLDGELSYGWRMGWLPGIWSSLTSHSRTGFGGDLTRAGLAYLSSSEGSGGGLRMEFTLGREAWFDQRVGYQLALTVSSAF